MEMNEQTVLRHTTHILVWLSGQYGEILTNYCAEFVGGDRLLAAEIAQQTLLEWPKSLAEFKRGSLEERLKSTAARLCVPHTPQLIYNDWLHEDEVKGELSESDRLLLFMVDNGLRPRNIAIIIGIKSGTIRTRIHRAKQRLERLLEASSNA